MESPTEVLQQFRAQPQAVLEQHVWPACTASNAAYDHTEALHMFVPLPQGRHQLHLWAYSDLHPLFSRHRSELPALPKLGVLGTRGLEAA